MNEQANKLNQINFIHELIEKGNIQKAYFLCNKLSKNDCSDSDLFCLLAHVYGSNGEFVKAKELIIRSIQLNPRQSYNYYVFEKICKQQKNIELRNKYAKDYYKACLDILRSYLSKKNFLFQIVGVPRSGTTLLASIIENQDNCICFSEPFWEFTYLNSVSVPISLSQAINIKNIEKFSNHPAIVFCKISMLLADTNTKIGYKETFRAIQNPNSSFIESMLSLVDTTISIVRDPRDIWVSTNTRFPGRTSIITDQFTSNWNYFIDFIISKNIPYIKYEDLVSSNANCLKKIGNVLNLSSLSVSKFNEFSAINGFGDKNGLSGGKIFDTNVSRWKQEIDRHSLEYILSRCARGMKLFGYLD